MIKHNIILSQSFSIKRLCLKIFTIFVIFTLLLQGSNAQVDEGCDAKEGPISCQSCVTKTASINNMANIPRVNLDLKSTPRNLAYYENLYSCFDDTSGIPCIVDDIQAGDFFKSTSEPTNVMNYGQSLVWYAYIGAFFFLIVIIGFISLCFGRYICGICCSGGCGLCCSSYPTRKDDPENKRCCCPCLGFVEDEKALTGFSYPCWEKAMARIWTWVYCVLLFIFLWIIGFSGVEKVSNAAKTLVKSPNDAVLSLSGVSNTINVTLHTTIKDALATASNSVGLALVNEARFTEFYDTNNDFMDSVMSFTDLSDTLNSLDSLISNTDALSDESTQMNQGGMKNAQVLAVQAAYDDTPGSFVDLYQTFYTAVQSSLEGSFEFVTAMEKNKPFISDVKSSLSNLHAINDFIDPFSQFDGLSNLSLATLTEFKSVLFTTASTIPMEDIAALITRATTLSAQFRSHIDAINANRPNLLNHMSEIRNFITSLDKSYEPSKLIGALDTTTWPFIDVTIDTNAIDVAGTNVNNEYGINSVDLKATVLSLANSIDENAKTASNDLQEATLLSDDYYSSQAAINDISTQVTKISELVTHLHEGFYNVPQEIMDGFEIIKDLPQKLNSFVNVLSDTNVVLQDATSKIKSGQFSFSNMFDELNNLTSLYSELFDNAAATRHISNASDVLSNINTAQITSELRNTYSNLDTQDPTVYDMKRYAEYIDAIHIKLIQSLTNAVMGDLLRRIDVLEENVNLFDATSILGQIDDTEAVFSEFINSDRGYCSDTNAKLICDLTKPSVDECGTSKTCIPGARVCYRGDIGSISKTGCHIDANCSQFGSGSYCIAGYEILTAQHDLYKSAMIPFTENQVQDVRAIAAVIDASINPTSYPDVDVSTISPSDLQLTNLIAAMTKTEVDDFIDFTIKSITLVKDTIITKNHANGVAGKIAVMSTFFNELHTSLLDSKVNTEDFASQLQDVKNESKPEFDRLNNLLLLPSTCILPFSRGLANADWETLLFGPDGTQAVIDDAIMRLNNAVDCLNHLQDFIVIETPVVSPDSFTSIVNLLNDFYKVSDVSNVDKVGGLHKILTTIEGRSDTAPAQSSYISEDDPTANRYDVDINGDIYPDGKRCVTLDCLNNTIEYYFSESSVNENLNISGVAISYKGLLQISFIVPALIVIILLLATICGCLARCCQKCSIHLTNCSLALMFFQNCFGLLIIGMVLFPALIAYHDTCQSSTNIGDKYLSSKSPTICTSMGGIYSESAQMCTYSDSTYEMTFSFNLQKAYNEVLTNSCAAGNSVEDVYSQIESQLPVSINSIITKEYEPTKALEDTQVMLRQILSNVATKMGQDVGGVASTLNANLGCEQISKSITSITSSACCDVPNALYWIIAGWYWIIFFTCFCGIPGALLGRKRFPRQPWGKEYEKNLYLKANPEASPKTVPYNYEPQYENNVVAPEPRDVYVAESPRYT